MQSRTMKEKRKILIHDIENNKISSQEVLQNISSEYLNEEVYLALIKKNSHLLMEVPDKFLNKEMCLIAAINDEDALLYIPSKFHVKEIYLTAISYNNGRAIRNISEEKRDKELYKTLLKNYKFPTFLRSNVDEWVLELIPETLWKDKEFSLEILNYHGQLLKYIPELVRDKDLCLMAIKNDITALKYIPKILQQEMVTKEMYEKALSKGLEISDVPEAFRDGKICLIAVEAINFYKNKKDKYYVMENIINNIPDYLPDESKHQIYLATKNN